MAKVHDPLAPFEYAAYMQSSEWRARRTAYFGTHDKTCAACGAVEDIHLHHHTYARLGCELDADLTVLCGDCHQVVHRYHRTLGGSLKVATRAVVDVMQLGGKVTPRRLAKVVPVIDRGHVPVQKRTAITHDDGRVCVTRDWQDESRPWWTRRAATRNG